MSPRLRKVVLYGVMALALLAPRLPALGSFATLDEPAWLTMGADYYYALGQREFQKTVYEYQPAVTTMSVVTAAMLIHFPEYRGFGQGYLDYEKETLDAFMVEHGHDPRRLLEIARLIQVVIVTGLLLVCFHLLGRLVGVVPAAFGVLLASLDPFTLGQSRLLNHEAMLVGFGAISVFALAVYLFQGRRLPYLLLSAVSAGLAQLTKSSGVALLAPVGFLLAVDLFQNRSRLRPALMDALKTLALWLAGLAVTYFILWPGMWVDPGRMLYEVYGNAFSFAFRGARLIALEDTPAVPMRLDALSGMGAQVMTFLWHTPLATWIGALLGAGLLLTRRRETLPFEGRVTAWAAAVTALAFLLMFGIAQGRNSPHYILTAFWMLGLLAALGWYMALRWLVERARLRWLAPAGMALLLLMQAGAALANYPYYFTYENPLLTRLLPRVDPVWAYGEGLETAAQYLGSLPGAEDSTALSYYGRGCFSYFFPGRTTRFKPYYAEPGYEAELEEALGKADYLVLYPAVQGSIPKYAELFNALAGVEPVREFSLNGYRYTVIYRVADLTPEVYEQLLRREPAP